MIQNDWGRYSKRKLENVGVTVVLKILIHLSCLPLESINLHLYFNKWYKVSPGAVGSASGLVQKFLYLKIWVTKPLRNSWDLLA